VKLVRDKIPEIAPHRSYRRASRSEMPGLLAEKVLEEARELRDNPSLEEMADVYEALRALAEALGYSWGDVVAEAEKKRLERGGFVEGWVLLEE